MKNPARWLIALALCACVLAWWWNRPPPEPKIKGVLLSQWMREHWRRTTRQEMSLEIGSIGDPAVKWLAYAAEYGSATDEQRGVFSSLLAKMRRPGIASQQYVSASGSTTWYSERLFSTFLLGELGPKAGPAIPVLARLLESVTYDQVSAAAGALNRIGPDSWPVVEDRLAHGSNLVRCELLNTMWQRLDADSGVVPESEVNKVLSLLTQALHDPEPNVRRNAASSLAGAARFAVAEHPSGPLMDEAAAALWPLPDERNVDVRAARKSVLKYYAETKAESVPRLTALLADPDEAKRHFARAMLDELSTH